MILVIVVGFLLFTTGFSFAGQAGKPVIDSTNAAKGYIYVRYPGARDTKIKIIIEKDQSKYTYTLYNTEEGESFSLQMGQGSYKVTVYENISGTSYRAVLSETIDVAFADANQPFLQSVQSIEWKESAAAASKAEELTRGLKTDEEKVKLIYNYVLQNIKYDHDKMNKVTTGYVPVIDEVLLSGKGICYDFASVTACMLRSVGIPAKLVKGYSSVTPIYHAWNEVYLDGEWIIIDTSHDSQMNDYKTPYVMSKAAIDYDKKYEY